MSKLPPSLQLALVALRLSLRLIMHRSTPHTQPYADGDGPSTLSNIDVRILRVHHSTLPVRPSRFPSIWPIGVYASAALPPDWYSNIMQFDKARSYNDFREVGVVENSGMRYIFCVLGFLILFIISLTGCVTKKKMVLPSKDITSICDNANDCDYSKRDISHLSEIEQCRLRLLAARCNAKDKCLINCIISGEGQNVGGGCFHNCGHVLVTSDGSYYECPEWTPPKNWDDCSQDEKENRSEI